MAVGSAGAAHIAESKTMRNALIKLARTLQAQPGLNRSLKRLQILFAQLWYLNRVGRV
jgi:hypothetical protein